MEAIVFGDNAEDAKIAILIKKASFNTQPIEKYYIEKTNIPSNRFAAVSLYYDDRNKITAVEGKAYIKSVLNQLSSTNIDTLFVADSNYFKFLTGKQKVKEARGYVTKCVIVGFTDLNVILSTNYSAMVHNPNHQKDLDISLTTLENHYTGNDTTIGGDIIGNISYPTETEYKDCLDKLHQYPQLTCDIEAFSLRFEKAGIATIGFAWNKHDGTVFDIDFNSEGIPVKNWKYDLLREFFDNYQGKLIAHNLLYEIKVFVYWLYMKHDSDWSGMRNGLSRISTIFEDSMIAAYLCINNTVDNQLSLKELAYEYSGAYAIDVKDITKHSVVDLMEYNAVDCLSTSYVWDKYWTRLDIEDQKDYYLNHAMPFVKPAAKMMLTGLPMDMGKVNEAKRILEREFMRHRDNLLRSLEVKKAQNILATKRWRKKNSELKKKIKPLKEFIEPFNPNSDNQVGVLLYQVLNLPILDTTKSGEPSTSSKIIKRLLESDDSAGCRDILKSLIGFSEVSIILSTFISAFIKYEFVRKTPDEFNGTSWLNGNLKITGTKSGRLSSSEPNMQNLPSGSKYGALVKSCFVAPPGWVICGADFAALEDRINSVKTNDPNKIKVYADGYDGHSLRAFSYYGDLMPDIDANSVESINSIQNVYPKLRSRSKNPTFALVYNGTHNTLVKNLGFSLEEALKIETNYMNLYRVSLDYADTVTRQTALDGYIKLAFGLKLRAPALSKWNLKSKLSYNQASESRTVNNADSQSYGQLMNRAITATEARLESSEFVDDILIMNTIHDAVYYLVREKPEPIKWLNDTLIQEMSWNDDPSIKHEDVPLTAELDIGYSWDKQETLHNNASIDEIGDFLMNLNDSDEDTIKN